MMKLYSLANNQNVVVQDDSLTLFSYDTAVCKIVRSGFHEIIFSYDWDYSKTTTKYVCRFLSDYFSPDKTLNKTVIKKMLDNKEYNFQGQKIPVKLVENI